VDSPQKLATYGTQDDDKQSKNTTQTRHEHSYKQLEEETDRTLTFYCYFIFHGNLNPSLKSLGSHLEMGRARFSKVNTKLYSVPMKIVSKCPSGTVQTFYLQMTMDDNDDTRKV